MVNLFLRKSNILSVEHLMNITTIIMVVKGSFNAKFVFLHNETKPSYLYALTVVLHLRSKSNINILEYINATILNVHIIRIILRNFPKISIMLININTSFTIYTVNSILTSLRWIYIQYKNILQDLLLKRLTLI